MRYYGGRRGRRSDRGFRIRFFYDIAKSCFRRHSLFAVLVVLFFTFYAIGLVYYFHEKSDSKIQLAEKKVENKFNVLKDRDFSQDPGLVHIFYYPWYGNPEIDENYIHWNHELLPHWEDRVNKKIGITKNHNPRHKPPKDIGASFYPELGPYSSGDYKIISKHFNDLLNIGISVVVVSWHSTFGLGQESGRNDITFTNVPKLFEVAEKTGMRIAFHLEPYDDRTSGTTYDDLKYIFKTFGKSPAFYRSIRHSNRPVFYCYDSYKMEDEQWKKLLSTPSVSNIGVRGTELDGVFLGLYMSKLKSKTHLQNSGFDGYYTYFASDTFSEGANYKKWKTMEKLDNMLFVPSVGPGYDDLRVRPWNKQNVKSRNGGKYYENYWTAAINSKSDFISITSFNEWHEGTQIEASVPFESDNFKYKDYQDIGGPDVYMEMTKKYVLQFYSKFKNMKSQKFQDEIEVSYDYILARIKSKPR